MEADRLESWIGRQETAEDGLTPGPVEGLSATLDRDDPKPSPGDPLPPLWHWLYFLPRRRQSELDRDGHGRRGGFLPPIALPRRMWAGGRLTFARPLRIGEEVRRISTIKSIETKSGKSGALAFVTVRHEISGSLGGSLSEEQDIVYREAAKPGDPASPPRPARGDAAWAREVAPDPTLLFRYSALTFNSHRIHYDRSYATEVEDYPGLVVHGPLLATLLADLARRCDRRPLASFSFRALAPLFDSAPFTVCGIPAPGDQADLWARSSDGALAVEAKVRFEGGAQSG